MTLIATLLGILIASIGALGAAAPGIVLGWLSRLQSTRGLLAIASFRVSVGVVLLLAAPESRGPGFLRIIGVLALFSGILTPFFGVQRFEAIMDWWTSQPPLLSRFTFGVMLLIGICIVLASRP